MDVDKLMIYQNRKVDPTTIWILLLLFGWSYGSLGKIGTQVLFYITIGGLGFWALIRLFTLNGSVKEFNKQIAIQLGFTPEELLQLGLS